MGIPDVLEIILKGLGIITASATVIGLVVKAVTKYRQIVSYKEDIEALNKKVDDLSEALNSKVDNLSTSTLAQFQTFAAEQTIQTHVLNAVLDGLQQLGCNHTVPKAKKDLEDYLVEQAHKVERL